MKNWEKNCLSRERAAANVTNACDMEELFAAVVTNRKIFVQQLLQFYQ